MKAWRYRRLRRRGYRIVEFVNVRHRDDLFSDPPVTYRRSSRLVLRKGLQTRTIRFRMTVEQLQAAVREVSA